MIEQGNEFGRNFRCRIATAARRNQHNIEICAAEAKSDATGKIQLECGDCPRCHRFQIVSAEKENKNVFRRLSLFFIDNFRGANKQNECQGRLGFALLQHSTDSTAAKLILYRTKTQILSTAQVVTDKSLTYKQDYLQYTDDSNVFWSLNFAASDEADVFLQELDKKCTVTRANTTEIAPEAIKIETELPEVATEIVADAESIEPIVDASMQKSNIVLRMAKVGQALPMLSATGPPNENDTDSSVSSIGGGGDDVSTSLVLTSLPSHSISKPTNISVAVQPVPNYWHTPSATAAAVNYSSTNLNNFISENRVQNAEVRMNISKLETKLERVLDNIEMLKLSSGKSAARNAGIDYEDEVIKLEEKIVELKKENRLLKLKLAESESKEPSVALSASAVSLATVASPASEDLASVKQELEMANNDLEKLRHEKADQETKIQELERKLKDETEKATAATKAKADLQTKLKAVEIKLKAEMELKVSIANNSNTNIQRSNAKIAYLEKSLKAMAAKVAEKARNGVSGAVAATEHETIRSIMNKLYVELFQSVNGRDTMTSAEVLKLTAELIRRETKAALNQTT